LKRLVIHRHEGLMHGPHKSRICCPLFVRDHGQSNVSAPYLTTSRKRSLEPSTRATRTS
jgi:hypothetical protein